MPSRHPETASETPGTPLIVQSDGSVLLDVHGEGVDATRSEIAPFAELVKSPEHVHTYQISPLSLWNAASAGLSSEEILETVAKRSRFPIPDNVAFTIQEQMGRYGMIRLKSTDDENVLVLEVPDRPARAEIEATRSVAKHLQPHGDDFLVPLHLRGTIKLELIRIGYPVVDEAPLREGEAFPMALRSTDSDGDEFSVRSYQQEAVESFVGDRRAGTGFGTVVLPCGAGKTIVGMAAMASLATNTLVLTTNVAAVHQWIDELCDKSDVPRDAIGEYTGSKKEIKPITITTYQILVWRADKASDDFPHFKLFRERAWGLIIYDEVHLLPAPIFRVTAELQAIRRLGLTATLVREDGREEDVFTLVGPKRYDVPWKELEAKGFIATAECFEIRVELPSDDKINYAVADKRAKFRIASENPLKLDIVKQLVENHREDAIIVIGQYLSQLDQVAKLLEVPLITGKTKNDEREVIYDRFRRGEERVIVVSKVANFAIDLPDASVAVQISGSFGSRQEEAQRLGRILRPKERNSFFYSVVSRHTVEENFSANRQKFLTEQGYKYHIEVW